MKNTRVIIYCSQQVLNSGQVPVPLRAQEVSGAIFNSWHYSMNSSAIAPGFRFEWRAIFIKVTYIHVCLCFVSLHGSYILFERSFSYIYYYRKCTYPILYHVRMFSPDFLNRKWQKKKRKRERIQGQHTLQIVSFRYCCFFLSFLFVFLFIILSSYLIRYTYKKSIRYDLFLKKNYLSSFFFETKDNIFAALIT